MPSPKDPRKPSDNYRKPPAEYQFKKGQSGNPDGRPKKKLVQPKAGALGGGIEDRMSAMVLAEANRLITVPEGDKSYEMPAMQAVLRTVITAATKGDVRAAIKVIDVFARAESERAMAAQEIRAEAAQHIEKHRPIFESHEREGLEPPHIYPQPDDVLINKYTGEVRVDGPISKEEALTRKAFRERALQATSRYFDVRFSLAKDPTNRALRKELKDLQKYVDFLEEDSEREARHKALQLARRAAEHDDCKDDLERSSREGETLDRSSGTFNRDRSTHHCAWPQADKS